jgi:hypothetical protein
LAIICLEISTFQSAIYSGKKILFSKAPFGQFLNKTWLFFHKTLGHTALEQGDPIGLFFAYSAIATLGSFFIPNCRSCPNSGATLSHGSK